MNTSADVVALDQCTEATVDATALLSALAALPDADDVLEIAAVFGLLADPGRLRVLIALRAGELCVCDLAAVSGHSESATSHALRLLRAHRVVRVRRVGRRAYYRLDDGHVQGLLALALAHLEHGAAGSSAALRADEIEARP